MPNTSRRDTLGFISALAISGATTPMPSLSQEARPDSPKWRAPEELVQIGFRRSRVLMMNEAHDGPRRCIRTREVGISIIPAAHAAGARYLAMEALTPDFATIANRDRKLPSHKPAYGAYLDQPEMREFMQSALSRGWELIAYEADPLAPTTVADPLAQLNWREEQQGRKLTEAVKVLRQDARVLVWCGWSHLSQSAAGGFRPMGLQFAQMSGIRSFAIDQTASVATSTQPGNGEIVRKFKGDLDNFGGTAGFLVEEGPAEFRGRKDADAFIISTQNALE